GSSSRTTCPRRSGDCFRTTVPPMAATPKRSLIFRCRAPRSPRTKVAPSVIVADDIAATEVFVGILDGRVLGSVEVRPATKFYDYEAKYKRTDTKYLVPPELAPAIIARVEALGLATYT